MNPGKRVVGLVALAGAIAFATTPARAVTGGTTIAQGDLQPGGAFQWLVRLESEDGSQRCTGSLVEQQWVLSANHCASDGAAARAFIGDSTTPIAINQVQELAGTDAAIFHLAAPAGPAVSAALIAPTTSSLSLNQSVLLAGWGLTTAGGPAPVAPSSGTMTFSGVDSGYLLLSPSPASSCAGDSGGPVFLRDADGTVHIFGVLSFSDPSCTADAGAVAHETFAAVADDILFPDLTAPVVRSGELRTEVNTPVEVPIEFSDPGGAPLTWDSIVDFTADHGSFFTTCASFTSPTTCTFVPDQDFVGIATLTFTVSDGTNSTTGVWKIDVYQVPTVSITRTTIHEPAGKKPQMVVVDVQLVGPVAGPVAVTIAPSGGTATSGADYRAAPLRLVLTDRNRIGAYRVQVLPDEQSEYAETINLSVSAPAGIKVVAPNPAVTILGDLSLPPVVQSGSVGAAVNEVAIIVAEISDPDGPPLTEDNLGTAWTVNLSYDNSQIEIQGGGVLSGGGQSFLGLAVVAVNGFTGSSPVTITITDEFGAAGSGTWNVEFVGP